MRFDIDSFVHDGRGACGVDAVREVAACALCEPDMVLRALG